MQQESRVSIVIDLSDGDRKLDKLHKVFAGLNKATDETGSKFDDFAKNVQNNAKLSDELKQAVKDLNGAYLDSAGRLHSANGKYLKMTDSMKKAINEVDGLEDALKRQRNGLNNVGDSANQAGTSLEELAKKTDDLALRAGRLRAKLDKESDALKNLSKGFEELASISKVALVGIGGAIGLTTKQAVDFEKAMAEINKTVDFKTPDGLKNMRKELEQLSMEIPQSFEELSAIAANAGQLGIAEKNIVGFTETIAKMGVAFDMTSSEVSDSMAKIANVFELPIDNIEGLGNTINALSNSMASTAPDIIGFMSRSASLAKSFKLSEHEAAAFGSALVALGWQPEVASTAFNSMIMKLSDLGKLGKNGKSAIKKLGLDTAEFASLVKTDGTQAIMTLLEAIKKIPEADRVSTISAIFGTEPAAKIASMVTGIGTVNQALESTKDTAGSLEKEFKAISETSLNKMELFRNNMAVASASIGEAFIPALSQLMIELTPIIQSIGEWASANPELITTLAGVSIGLTGAIVATQGLLAVFKTTQVLFKGVSGAITLMSNPIGIAVVAIGALVGVGYLLYKNWDTIKAKATEVFNGLPAPVQEAFNNIKSVFDWAKDWGGKLFSFMLPIWKAHLSGAVGIVKANFELVVGAIKTGWQAIKALFEFNITVISTAFNTGFKLIKNNISTALDAIKALADGDIKGFVSIIGNGIKNAVSIVGDGVSGILKAFGQLGKRLFEIGVHAIQGLVNGIKSRFNAVWSTVTNLADKVAGAFTKVLDIHSPSRLFKKYGGYIVDGLVLGIKGKENEATIAALNLAKSVSDSMADIKKEIYLMNQERLFDDNFNKALASFDYDRKNGAFKGLKDSVVNGHRELIKAKEDLIAVMEKENKINAGNENILNNIAGINRQLALGDNATGMQQLIYDKQHGDKYANASTDAMSKLTQATAASDFAGMMSGLNKEVDDPFAAELEKLRTVMGNRKTIIENALSNEVITRDKYNEVMRKNEEAFHKARNELALNKGAEIAGSLTSIAKNMAGEQSGIYRAMFAVEKGFAIAKSIINIQTAMSSAAASLPFPANLGAIATVASNVAGIVSNIKSVSMPIGQAHDGIMSVPKSGTWNLEKGERVLPERTAKAMDRKLAQSNNQQPVQVNIYNYTGEPVQQRTNDKGEIEVIVGKELKKQLPNHVNDPYSGFSKAMKNNYKLQRRTA